MIYYFDLILFYIKVQECWEEKGVAHDLRQIILIKHKIVERNKY